MTLDDSNQFIQTNDHEGRIGRGCEAIDEHNIGSSGSILLGKEPLRGRYILGTYRLFEGQPAQSCPQ